MSTPRIQVGDIAPNLQLITPQSQPVVLADLWQNGGLVLSFLRHFG